jgi:hypothetical protein
MCNLLRTLKIYDLIGIGDTSIIELSQWIDDTFSDLIIMENMYYNKADDRLILLTDRQETMWIDNKAVWDILDTKYNLGYGEIQDIMSYIMFKYYNITGYIAERNW